MSLKPLSYWKALYRRNSHIFNTYPAGRDKMEAYTDMNRDRAIICHATKPLPLLHVRIP